MKLLPLLLLAATSGSALAKDLLVLAEDDASLPAYKSAWKNDSGGTGFREWTLRTQKGASGESHAGFYVADTAGQKDLLGAALRGRAFAIYANGNHFEAAAAFRRLKKPLSVGHTFSFLLKHGTIEKKYGQDDPGTGGIGLTLRSGSAAESVGDYNRGARFEFGSYEGRDTYQIYDGDTSRDSGIRLSEVGVSVSLTLVTPDTYDLEVTTLGDKKTTTLKGCKLGGEKGAALESFCVFNRDGEKSDAFFNGFQVLGANE